MGEFLNLGSDGNAAPMTVSSPARAVDTNFVPNTQRPVLCIYSFRVTGAAGGTGHIELRADFFSPPTTVRARAGGGNVVATWEETIVFLAPPGWTVRIATVIDAGAPAFLLLTATEIVL